MCKLRNTLTTCTKVDYNELRRAIQNDEWARQRCLIGIASGNDGGSGLQEPGGDSNGRRQELERLADFVLASSPAQESFWHGRGVESLESLRVSHGGTKACLHGTDAHDLGGIGKPDEDRYNWIKGAWTTNRTLMNLVNLKRRNRLSSRRITCFGENCRKVPRPGQPSPLGRAALSHQRRLLLARVTATGDELHR